MRKDLKMAVVRTALLYDGYNLKLHSELLHCGCAAGRPRRSARSCFLSCKWQGLQKRSKRGSKMVQSSCELAKVELLKFSLTSNTQIAQGMSDIGMAWVYKDKFK